jgi:hypothetical protein
MALLTSRKTIRQRVLRELGGLVATVASGSTTAVVLNELENRFADDNALKNWRLLLPDGAAADQQRFVSAWDDSAATISPNATFTDAPTASDEVELYAPGDPTHHEMNEAINRALQELRRPTWSSIPTRRGARRYGRVELPWVRDRFDVLSVRLRRSPNLLDNEDFENWGTGESPALSGWVLAGTGALSTRTEPADAHAPFAVRLSRVGTDTTLTQTPGLLDRQLVGKTLSVSVLCQSSVAAAARLRVTDGSSTTNSSYHTGGGGFEALSLTHTVAAGATTLQVQLRHETTNGTSMWARAIAIEGSSVPTWLSEHGSEYASVDEVRQTVANTPDGAAIVLADSVERGTQLYVQSLQPYAELDSDSAVTDCPVEAAMALTLVRLARRRRAGENRARWDEVLGSWAPSAQRWQRRQRTRADVSQRRVVVGGV